MRRAERPGDGQEEAGGLEKELAELKEMVSDLRENREISGKTKARVKAIIGKMDELKEDLSSLLNESNNADETIEVELNPDPLPLPKEKTPEEGLMEYLTREEAYDLIKSALKIAAGRI